MNAEWLTAAREQGIALAKNTDIKTPSLAYAVKHPKAEYQRFSQTFQEEQITTQDIQKFLDTYMVPLLAVLNDLRTFSSDGEHPDFIVTELEDDLFYLGDVPETGGSYFRDQYALAEVRPSFRGLTDYRVDENYAYGRRQVVKHWTNERLGAIRLFPRTNTDTHLAGVEYQFNHYSEKATQADQFPQIEDHLKIAIAAWYSRYIKKQAQYFEW